MGEWDLRDVERTPVDAPCDGRFERIVEWRAGSSPDESTGGPTILTMDRRPLGRRAGSGPWRACPIRPERSRVGALFATEPQCPRMKSMVGDSIGTRHSRVIGKIGARTAPITATPPRRQACACHRACINGLPRACGAVSPAHRGPQAPRQARSRPWRREVRCLALPWRAGPVDSRDS